MAVILGVLLIVLDLESLTPLRLVDIEEHLSFQIISTCLKIDGIVGLVKTMSESLVVGWVDMSKIGGSLTWFNLSDEVLKIID